MSENIDGIDTFKRDLKIVLLDLNVKRYKLISNVSLLILSCGSLFRSVGPAILKLDIANISFAVVYVAKLRVGERKH